MGLIRQIVDKLNEQQSEITQLIVMVHNLCPHKESRVVQVNGCPGPVSYIHICTECGAILRDANEAEYKDYCNTNDKEKLSGGSI